MTSEIGSLKTGKSTSISYGWAVVAALSLTETVSYGVLYYAFTVFIEPMQVTLGWSREAITGAYSLSLLVSGIAALSIGRWIDVYGARRIMTIGAVAASLLVAGWAFVDSLFAFYALWVGLGFASAAVLYEPAFALIMRWFQAGRSSALTTLTFIAGFASVIFIPLAGRLTADLGWRPALLILAAILALLTIPVNLFVLRDPPRLPATPHTPSFTPLIDGVSARDAFRRRDFWWLTISFTLSVFVFVGVGVHLVPFLISRGYEPIHAATLAGAIGVVALPGRLIFTPLGARISRHAVAALLFITTALGLIVLLFDTSEIGVWAFIILYGLGFGAVTPAKASLIAETFGTAHYGDISGRITFFGALPRAVSPFALSLLISLAAGSYQAVLIILIAAAGLAAFGVIKAKTSTPIMDSP